MDRDQKPQVEEIEDGESGNKIAAFLRFLPWKTLLSGMMLIAASYAIRTWESYPFVAKAFTYTFMKEFGIALVIAYFISAGIERSSRISHNNNVKYQLKRISKNVFEAIFERNHDKKLIDLITREIFEKNFFRRNASMVMALRPINVDDDISNPDTPVFCI